MEAVLLCMSTESREESDNFRQADKENHHWYDCDLCEEDHLVDDDADAFKCPNVPEYKPNAILFV